MKQYVTLVSNWVAQGKSHVVYPQPSPVVIETMCGKSFSFYDRDVRVTDTFDRLGVCKLCERKAK